MSIKVLTKAEAFEDVDAICAGVLVALNEMAEAAGFLGVDGDIQCISDALVSLHTKASLSAMEAAH